MESYERHISTTAFSVSVLAYRSGIGNNIDHAKALFDEIRSRGECSTIAVDITSFFDKIGHDPLYQAICKVRERATLGSTDYKVFRRMTRFDWVNSDDARERLGFRYGRSNRICNGFEFRTLLRQKLPKLVNTNTNSFGIPQGTPLSGLYANISMLDFDAAMTQAAQLFGGSYRRYSDDIALVIPTSEGPAFAIDAIRDNLRIFGLELSDGKTKISNFSRKNGRIKSTEPFQYLGFTFDGENTRVRQSSLNRYYSKMNQGIRAKVYAAKHNGIAPDEMFLRQLYKKYTHFGQHRNFPRYVYRAAEVHQAPEMRAQIARHMAIFKKMLSGAIADIY